MLLATSSGGVESSAMTQAGHPSRYAEQVITLIAMDANDQKAVAVKLRLAWKPTAIVTDEPLTFDLDPKADPRLTEMLRSQLWLSALAAGMILQQPWITAHWTVSEVPFIEGPAVGGGLGLGLIATATDTLLPQDTTIMGSLYPNGGIGPVSHITQRIEVAAAAGIKRLVLSNLQRFEVSKAGSFLNIQNFAKTHGIACTFVDHLSEATEQVLHRTFPSIPETQKSLRYEGPLFTYLDSQCRKELDRLQVGKTLWPRKPEQLSLLQERDRELWGEVFKNYDLGLDAYRAGLVYVTHKRFQKANSLLNAISAPSVEPDKYDFKEDLSRATLLRQKIAAHIDKPSIDQNELHAALMLAEESAWLYEINAQLEGSQILVRQAFGPRSHATKEQKRLAANRLGPAIHQAEYLLKNLEFYSELYTFSQPKRLLPVVNRATSWLAQLTPTFLASAEFLSQGLQLHSNEFRETLLFDPRLATLGRVLRDAHAAWEQQIERKISQQRTQPVISTMEVGFVPGAGYAPPTPPVPPPIVQNIGAAQRPLNWVNDFCEVAMLEQKYLGPGGVFEPHSLEWKSCNRAAVQSMLQVADVDARQGIAFAERIGMDSSALILIYENASFLRNAGDDLDKLEALKQFWRCSLLGNFCWQIITNPRIPAPPSAVTPLIVNAQPSDSLATVSPQMPLSSTTNAAPSSVTVPSEIIDPVLMRPSSVRALPISLEELDRLPEP
jgi:hypothetical protein